MKKTHCVAVNACGWYTSLNGDTGKMLSATKAAQDTHHWTAYFDFLWQDPDEDGKGAARSVHFLWRS